MTRPFRYHPPSSPEAVVPRPRLAELLAKRWDRRMITVVAGPGFGKTVVLAAAIAEPSGRAGQDVWLTCEPADEAAEHLTAALAHALDLASGADLDAVLDAVWARAPVSVCLVLDDVHEIPRGSPGAAIVGRLATDLAANGHLVLASRDAVPIPVTRLAASGQLVRIDEHDLVFSLEEQAMFATARRADPALLAASGGWPALAELTVAAGRNLVPDYLWEEVLSRLGEERATLLAAFALAGGGDDEVAAAVADRPCSVDEIVASVPLIERSAEGWAVPHPLWKPALRRVVTADRAAVAQRRAAEVHRRRARFGLAVELFAEAEAWDEVLQVVGDAEPYAWTLTAADFGRWLRLLPADRGNAPQARVAAGLERGTRAPAEAAALFDEAAAGFRDAGDLDGELSSLARAAYVWWLTGDVARLMPIYARVGELAAGGSERAGRLERIGVAAFAHLQGDSATVLSALADLSEDMHPGWLPLVCWLRSVAHRRNGDLGPAYDELDRAAKGESERGVHDLQREVAQLRVDWLAGRVDHVEARLAEISDTYLQSEAGYLAKEIGLELAGKLAWLGDADRARAQLAATAPLAPGVDNALTGILDSIARAAIAVVEGREEVAAELLRGAVLEGPAALGSAPSWYWRDRAAIALVHVLVPESRSRWAGEALGPAHAPGLVLAEAFEAARDNDVASLRDLRWPDTGVLRAHLPLPWAMELAAAGAAVRNAPPDDLLDRAGQAARSTLRRVATARSGPVAAAAKRLAAEISVAPSYRLRIGVVGPLQVWRDDVVVEQAEVRRQRVRELLCYLVVRHRVRREEAAEELWPDVADPAHNLRVTLNYVQRLLQPDRPEGERPYFLRTVGSWLELVGDDRLEIDAWGVDARLDEAEAAERTGSTAAALTAYRAALPIWRGEPYADAPYALWAEPARARVRSRYVTAALRAGELLLAAGSTRDARSSAHWALRADPTSEPAHRLLARTHLAEDDVTGAQRALQQCRAALADLGVAPDAITEELEASLRT